MIRTAILCATVLSLPALAPAQEKKAPKINLRPPKTASYSVTVRTKAGGNDESTTDENGDEIAVDDNGKDGRTVIDVILTGETGRAETRNPDGSKTEVYMFRDLFLAEDKRDKRVRPYKFDQYAPVSMRFAWSYPFIDWVNPKYFVERIEYQGKDCYHFVQEANTGSQKPIDSEDAAAYDNRFTPHRREVWFEAATGLPIAFKDGNKRGTFTHRKPARTPVKLPKPYEDAVRYYFGL